MDRGKFRIALGLVAIFTICSFVTFPTAQLGEVAGQLNFTVPVGYNRTLQWHLLNEGNTSIAITLVPPGSLLLTSKTPGAANQPLPVILVTPPNAIVQPHSETSINVTVYIPKNETAGLATWEGVLSAQESSNVSNPGGAVIVEGVAKVFTISSILPPPPPTTSTIVQQAQAPITTVASSTNPILGALLLVIAVFAAYGYYRYLRKRGAGKPKPKGKKKEKPESDEAESLRREIARLKREQERLKRQVKTSKNPRRSASRKRKGSTKRKARRTRRRR